MTGERIAAEAGPLLEDGSDRAKMKTELAAVAEQLTGRSDAIGKAADEVVAVFGRVA